MTTTNNELSSSSVTAKTALPTSIVTTATTILPGEETSAVIVKTKPSSSKKKKERRIIRSRMCRAFSALLIILYIKAYFSLSSNPKDILSSAGQITYESATNNVTLSLYEQQINQIRRAASTISKTYQPVPPSVWCVDEELSLDQLKRRPMGLCYLKIPHAASDTLRGINIRIAKNFGRRQGLDGCIRHDTHQLGMYYALRDKLSYLWTFVRDPLDRSMSTVGKKLTKQYLASTTREMFLSAQQQQQQAIAAGQNTTTYVNLTQQSLDMLQNSANIHDGIVSEGRAGFQVQFAMQRYIEAWKAVDPLNPSQIVSLPDLLQDISKKVFDRFDFIGIVERFDESLVAMQLLLGLETSDILYIATNTRHKFQRVKISRGNYACRKPLDWETDILADPTLQDYVLNNPEWIAQNYGDYILYHAASQSLDRTIFQIGLDVFAYELKKFRRLLKEAQETCHPKFPCSETGEDQSAESKSDCFSGTVGCGGACLDSIAQKASTVQTLDQEN